MNRINTLVLAFLFSFALGQAEAQNQFTPYDDLPGIIKNYKPAYDPGFPKWAKMLYEYPVNFNAITQEYHDFSGNKSGELAAINRYYKIWSRSVVRWTGEDGTIHIPDLEEYDRLLYTNQRATNRSLESSSRSGSDWTFLGPKETFWLNESGSSQAPAACPWQVNVYSFDVADSDPNILYAGTETGFVNKSVDKGLSWDLCGKNYYFGGAVTATAIDPTHSEIVYVAAGRQIHKTVDGGANWMPMLPPGQLFHADRLKIDRSNPLIILAASDEGIFLSRDGGENWENPWNKRCFDVELKPDDPNTIYGLTKMNTEFTVVISQDGGDSFSPDPAFPAFITENSGGLLAVTPADPKLLLAVMLSTDNTPYLFKGIPESGNWDDFVVGKTNAFPMNNGQGYFDLILEISPINENIIFAGTTTLYKSTNGGSNFTAVGGYEGSFAIHPDIQDMKLLPNGETWVSTDGGFSITTDNFTSTNHYFSRNNGLVGSDMWGFDQGWNEDIVVGGRYHNGNTSIADFYQPKALRMGGAESPTGWVLQGKSRHVAFNDLGNGWILPETPEGKPQGRFIFSKYPNMDEYGGRRGNMAFHPNYYGTIILGEGNGIWKSTDMGVTFDLIYNFNAKVRYLQMSYSNPDVLYADVIGKGLCKSENGGLDWTVKTSLTGGQFGTSYWEGKLNFAISPYDENVMYACLQNGTWSADIGKVFRSGDGGETWEDWTGELSGYTKSIVIQPGSGQKEWVYLFCNSRNGQAGSVYVRRADQDAWMPFDTQYPAGMDVNHALPFFRDGKLRVAGNAGVWESPLAETDFTPILNPWVEKAQYNCMFDTLYFDDHSILNHDGVSWHWDIYPTPAFIDDPDVRNPKVVLGQPGSFTVGLTVTKNGEMFTKSIPDMVTTTTCPSIDDCGNPAYLPKDQWELLYVDSEELNYPGLATMAFDGDPSTIWHTRWSTGNDPYPHEIQIDLGQEYTLFKCFLLNRQDGQNGRIKEYELYLSKDPFDLGEPVSKGVLENTGAPQTILVDPPVQGRYMRLLALSEVNGNAWSSMAELDFIGCIDPGTNSDRFTETQQLIAFPVPSAGMITIPLPDGNRFNWELITISEKVVNKGSTSGSQGTLTLDLSPFPSGLYLIRLMDHTGRSFRIKVIKE